ncbi:MAG: disulfide reductase [Euryarchaeota archaeon RBG_19FT_COMBO_69_17]|nr:MAG: disulfide reductase [Euryarchaeota archaeon RBG_19FT_COMBO_69_17]
MTTDEPKIGVYVCDCGFNIAGVVNVPEVVNYAKGLRGVAVAREYKYMCSSPGQETIQKDIREKGLNRVVVASCSPHLHESTFRRAAESAGMNPYLVHMVNIREQVSWVTKGRDEATEKAKSLVAAGVARVARHSPLERREVPVRGEVLIMGGGIAGIQAALTAAEAGHHVYLVEREPSIGGHMARFDKTFPTLDCAACILTPKMTAVKNHANITLLSYSEVVAVDGYVGNFKVKVRRKPRYVDEAKCVGCFECIEECVYKTPKFSSEFELGLGKRKPIYIPFPQAVPLVAVIDPETCIEFKTGHCKKTCVEACGDRNAIDFKQQEQFVELDVGAIIVSTGFQVFDASRMTNYGYGRYPDVYNALEVERLAASNGPTGGEIVLRNGKKPSSVAIVHCVGSRDENYNPYCSKVCCMYSLKLAHLVKERTGAEVYSFYIDMRTPGKGYEEFYHRLLVENLHLIRGKVAMVTDIAESPREEGKLVVVAENTLLGGVVRVPVDMVVLSVALEPQADKEQVRRLLNMSCSSEGFFLEKHPKLAPVSTMTDGVFIAGACQGPKDIPETVAQAEAAAAEVLALTSKGFITLEPNLAYIDKALCSGCQVCIPLCPYRAIELDRSSMVAKISDVLCKGCGVCVAACPSGAALQRMFEDDQILDELLGVLS